MLFVRVEWIGRQTQLTVNFVIWMGAEKEEGGGRSFFVFLKKTNSDFGPTCFIRVVQGWNPVRMCVSSKGRNRSTNQSFWFWFAMHLLLLLFTVLLRSNQVTPKRNIFFLHDEERRSRSTTLDFFGFGSGGIGCCVSKLPLFIGCGNSQFVWSTY